MEAIKQCIVTKENLKTYLKRYFKSFTEDAPAPSADGGSQLPACFNRSVAPARYTKSWLVSKLKQICSSLFGKVDTPPANNLVVVLDSFREHTMAQLDMFNPMPLSAEALACLYSIQADPSDTETALLSLPEQQKQAAIKELLVTESSYILQLRTLVDFIIMIAFVMQKSGIMLDVDMELLFGDLPIMLSAHLQFWEKACYPVIKQAKLEKKFNVQLLSGGLKQFEFMFRPYQSYIFRQEANRNYFKSLMSSNVEFFAFIKWCESQKLCNRSKVIDLLMLPIQRITKYSVLIKAIHDRIVNETEKSTLHGMCRHSDCFVREVNAKMAHKQDNIKMFESLKTIENYYKVLLPLLGLLVVSTLVCFYNGIAML